MCIRVPSLAFPAYVHDTKCMFSVDQRHKCRYRLLGFWHKILAQQLETVNQEVQDAVELRSIQTTMQQQEAHRRVVEKRGELEGLLQETVTKGS